MLFTPTSSFRPGPFPSLSPPPLNLGFISSFPRPTPPQNSGSSPEPLGQNPPSFSLLWPPLPQESLATTETFKQQKVRMAKEGFDPSALSDPLYILDQARGAYLPLTPARYSALLAGDLRI